MGWLRKRIQKFWRHHPLYNVWLRFRREGVRGWRWRSSIKIPSLTWRQWLRRVPMIVVLLLVVGGGVFLAARVVTAEYSYRPELSSEFADSYTIKNYLVGVVDVDAESGYEFMNKVLILSINENTQQLSLLDVNPDYVIYVPSLDGRHSLRRVRANAVATEMDPDLASIEAVSSLLGVIINDYLMVDIQAYNQFNQLAEVDSADQFVEHIRNMGWTDIGQMVIGFDEFSDGIVSTNMNKWQMFSFINGLIRIADDVYTPITPNYGYVDEFSFGTGYVIDSTMADEEIGKLLENKLVVAEQLRFEVFNASEIGGMAGRVSRILNNYGINVVRYNNAPTSQQETVLYVADAELLESLNVRLVRSLFPDLQIVNEDYEFNSTAELVLVLGKDKLLSY